MDLQLNGSVRDPEVPKMTAVCSKAQGGPWLHARPLAVVRTTALHLKYEYDLPMRKAGVTPDPPPLRLETKPSPDISSQNTCT